MSLSQRLAEYISACFSALWLQSFEHEDALREIAQLCREQNWRLAVWDIEQGLQIPGQAHGQPTDAGGSDPLAAIRSINALASPDSSAILVLTNFHRYLASPEIVQALARQIGAKTVHICKPEVANRHSGYLVGGTSPFGTRKAMPVFVERTILDLERIFINGGSRGFLVAMAPAALELALHPTPVDAAFSPEGP